MHSIDYGCYVAGGFFATVGFAEGFLRHDLCGTVVSVLFVMIGVLFAGIGFPLKKLVEYEEMQHEQK